MSSQPSKTTPSKGFTCDCANADSPRTELHYACCWKVPICPDCRCRTDVGPCSCLNSDGYTYIYYDKYDIDYHSSIKRTDRYW